MLYPNNTISIYRWNTYSTTVIKRLRVYIYELNDDLSVVNDIDWWQYQVKMLTNYNNINIWDKITDKDEIVYIVKNVLRRISMIAQFYEVIMRRQYD